MPESPPIALTSAQVADLLRVSLRTVDRLVSSGQLRPAQSQPRGPRMFDPAEVALFAVRRAA